MKLKLAIFSILFTITQLYSMSIDEIKFYIKKYVEKKAKAEVQKIDVVSQYDVPNANGWKVYFLSIIAKVNINGKEQEAFNSTALYLLRERGLTLKLMKRGQLKSNGKREEI